MRKIILIQTFLIIFGLASLSLAHQSTVTLNSSAELDGYVTSGGAAVIWTEAMAGDTWADVAVRGFLSFDISSIPTPVNIISATLRAYQEAVIGTPYADLGNVIVDHLDYGSTLDGLDYDLPALRSNIGILSNDTAIEYKTLDVTACVLDDMNNGRTRSQYRLLFPTPTDYDESEDSAFFTTAMCCTDNFPEIVITYEVELSGFGTPMIDGVLSPGEWDSAGSVDFPVNTPPGGVTDGTLSVMNDRENLYIAIWFDYADVGNTAAISFDNDHGGGVLVSGDDLILYNPNPLVEYRDEVWTIEPPCPGPSLCSFFDTDVDGTNDGAGAFSNYGGFTVYEFSHPLDSMDDEHDFSLELGETVGFNVFIRLIASGEDFADTNFPALSNAAAWSYGDIVIALPPIEALEELIATVESFNLQQGIQNSLDSKLENTMDALEAANAGQREDAINKLQAFINAVEAQRGKELTEEQADTLINMANYIIELL